MELLQIVTSGAHMFINSQQLAYELHPDAYRTQQIHDAEQELLFRHSWHFVGTRFELSKDGDYLTYEILGTPVIIHRTKGELFAFENVCGHRHCTLRDDPRGNLPRLRCQYHGWEYKSDGYTAHIPDAVCFRPFDRERARLKPVRLESCGSMLFVCLDESAPSLRDWMGPSWDLALPYFDDRFAPNVIWDFEVDCNWKILIENTAESYHLPEVHKGFFSGVYPPEEFQSHVIEDTYSQLTYDMSYEKFVARNTRVALRMMGERASNIYHHVILYPGTVLILTDILSMVQSCLPISPRKCKSRIRTLHYKGLRRGPVSWILGKGLKWIGSRVIYDVISEDKALFPSVQRGIEATSYRGCLGTREERTWAFQEYLLKQLPDIGWARDEVERTRSPKAK